MVSQRSFSKFFHAYRYFMAKDCDYYASEFLVSSTAFSSFQALAISTSLKYVHLKLAVTLSISLGRFFSDL